MQNKSSGVELLVVGALALIAIVSLTFVGLTVMWNRSGDITPLVSITGVAVGALASLLVKLQGQGSDTPMATLTAVTEPIAQAPSGFISMTPLITPPANMSSSAQTVPAGTGD